MYLPGTTHIDDSNLTRILQLHAEYNGQRAVLIRDEQMISLNAVKDCRNRLANSLHHMGIRKVDCSHSDHTNTYNPITPLSIRRTSLP